MNGGFDSATWQSAGRSVMGKNRTQSFADSREAREVYASDLSDMDRRGEAYGGVSRENDKAFQDVSPSIRLRGIENRRAGARRQGVCDISESVSCRS